MGSVQFWQKLYQNSTRNDIIFLFTKREIMETKKCLGCQKDFINKPTQKLYCTRSCRAKFRGEPRTCTRCSKTYIGRSKRKFCSMKCFGLSHAQETTDRNIRNRKYPQIKGLTRQQVYWRNNPECKDKCLKRDSDKRFALIRILGDQCQRCAYKEDKRALVLDHINGDGKADRKRIGARIYRYYIKNLDEAKKNIQVLCANCNLIKSFENNEHNISRRV